MTKSLRPTVGQGLAHFSFLQLAVVVVCLAGCATQNFVSPAPGPEFLERAISQTEDSITVTAAVPSAQEVIDWLGVDLYAEGVQPLWLRVDNRRQSHVRLALFSVDQEYYSPLEVAWMIRKRYVRGSRDRLNRWFVDNAMDRYVPAGGDRSGLVFTHVSEGTKGFNVDIHGEQETASFTFFVPMPGFKPDYMTVDFENLYAADEIIHGDLDTLRRVLDEMPCCTTDEAGEAPGDPLNVVLVGSGEAVRRALLRGGWHETRAGSALTRLARTHYFRGRSPDGTFHIARPDGSERKELRLWRAPMIIDEDPVWLGHLSYDMSGALVSGDLEDYTMDPDLDDARMFLVQNFWYHQSLRAFGMAGGVPARTIDAPGENFHGAKYFTDGLRAVLLVSEEPVAMDETEILSWEPYAPN